MESALSFLCVGPRTGTQVPRLGDKHLCPPSHLTSLVFLLFKSISSRSHIVLLLRTHRPEFSHTASTLSMEGRRSTFYYEPPCVPGDNESSVTLGEGTTGTFSPSLDIFLKR